MNSPVIDDMIVRTFWHGAPLGPYQLLCLRSFVDNGYNVEVFCYDNDIKTPNWIERRNAHDILPVDRVMQYQTGFGRNSFSLHSNLFRYAILHKLGGWWIDCDILLLKDRLPDSSIFVARQFEIGLLCGTSILRFPAGHALAADARNESLRVAESAFWGQTGAYLLTELVQRHGLVDQVDPAEMAYPVAWEDIAILFDPDGNQEMTERCKRSPVVHLFNEVWRGAGIPNRLGPPEGSFLDRMFRKHDFGATFAERMRYDEVKRWVSNRNKAVFTDRLETEIAALRASTSWKITAPLRKLAFLTRR